MWVWVYVRQRFPESEGGHSTPGDGVLALVSWDLSSGPQTSEGSLSPAWLSFPFFTQTISFSRSPGSSLAWAV